MGIWSEQRSPRSSSQCLQVDLQCTVCFEEMVPRKPSDSWIFIRSDQIIREIRISGKAAYWLHVYDRRC